ncbi:transcription termination/antitermination protein NusA [Candidatus Saccharibacteria bacterium]|nr:transcription termination/antitermination protein NusA [Candidatus Saccharibacteria bacterium]MBI3338118.1 transcription termination/antitermination protein NusA [Candidatus Saccharibacteria bacterium]
MDLDFKQLAVAIKAIAEEKNLPEEVVQEVVEQALAAAYRRDYGDREQEVRVGMNLNTGDIDVYVTKEVVDKVHDPLIQISAKDAGVMKKTAKVGDFIEVHENVEDFGRVAAQTAKQVILQRLREAERDIIMNEYEDKIGTVINGIVSRVEGNIVRVDIGKAQGIMPRSEQIQGERYYPGQRLKVFLKDVERGFRGPQLVVSRGNTQFIEWLFRAEVPEMENGAVEIKDIAREAGVRSKIAVASTVQGVDPVGTFVGGHGTRVNAVMGEIGEQEKIDIIVWSSNSIEYITNSLSPTKVVAVTLDEKNKKARVVVPEDQLSIAIGKSGQNVRLASKLAGYDIDIVAETAVIAETVIESKKPTQKLKKKEQLESSLLDAIEEHGVENE